MAARSLKRTLLAAVAALVMASSLLTTLLATRYYVNSLQETLAAQAENLAHGLSLQLTDLILVNDLAGVQKTLTRQLGSNPDLSYAFVVRDGQIIAHTFDRGIPVALIDANAPTQDGRAHAQDIRAVGGGRYIDFAWPILEGKAGVLRLGISEGQRDARVRHLWLQIGLISLCILAAALAGGLLFIRRITRPIAELVQATQAVDQNNLNVRVNVQGQAEVAALAESFNHMTGRIQDYMRRLEEQTAALELSHRQMRTSCEIVKGAAALEDLRAIGLYLLERSREIVRCRQMVLLVFNSARDGLFRIEDGEVRLVGDRELASRAAAALEGVEGMTMSEDSVFRPPLVPEEFMQAARQAVLPLHHESSLCGAMVIACQQGCSCTAEEMAVLDLIMTQAAGSIRRTVLHQDAMGELRQRLDSTAEFAGMIGRDPKMQLIYGLIRDVAPTDATVLIQGESGTGKELVAKAIHQQSPRSGKPFVVINCSAYPAALLESELFGHEKGAFTGAERQKPGRFEQADGGTVFLDEIGEIPPTAQVKLLRVLQTRTFERLGGERTLSVDVRILAATNRDLLAEVREKRFREDLYYRLDVIPIHMPPLRERGNDIALLARHFLRRFSAEQGRVMDEIAPKAMRLLLDYAWPGNVRELENVLEQATILARGGVLAPSDLPTRFREPQAAPERSMHGHEKRLLVETLEECGWNKKLAAKRLGIGRSTLYAKMKKHGIKDSSVQ
ncbi:Transcriptional regulator containing GAF, AAA-type ATPase, and DNA-binding Fis domains [Humidesulfovibrio mexicanus]|uniref:Transcriptional regulator containing GAF, AAA-type ATPase, and DNA-binding Fis domains n=1 Tax=Humidesulfovibrio mexicanus TaxID=147047 RepID=A0A239CIS5_9BACT|nr:sigma 54-interacting transcriptional regulator [Humidesulfovibrio mexicanus]SNS19601.1 Transcriptional regulator containing GAF, AAA-type ATPase, and DNA-binding Fis domains [Humidesulfovibrio mexicanus]